MTAATRVTLVAGGDAVAREHAIAGALRQAKQTAASAAVILEGGVPSTLFTPEVQLVRLAPACPCCVGNLTMRVTLNRILRHPPAHLFIGIAQAAHVDALREFLSQPPYDQHLTLADNIIL